MQSLSIKQPVNFHVVVIKPEGDCCKLPLRAKEEEAEEEMQKASENPAAATEGSVEQFVVLSELDGMQGRTKNGTEGFYSSFTNRKPGAEAAWLLWI